MKFTTIAFASVLTLSSTFALANTVRHDSSVKTYKLHRGVSVTKSGRLHRNYGNPNGDPNGPTTLSGTGSSAFGGSTAGTSGYN